MKWLALPLLALTLAACGTAPKKSPPPASGKVDRPSQTAASAQSASRGCTGKYRPAEEDLGKRGDYTSGGLYAPGVADTTPDYVPDVDCIAEPLVTSEAPSRVGNRSPYSVLGKQYVVMQKVDGYVEQGTASYYGNKFHGRRTSNQEVYDMYAFTAAHKTLPLPSFARVTNLDNGKSVVVRVNDRGPFHDGRVIDLSYAAAVKLGITQRGTGHVEVRALSTADKGTQCRLHRQPVGQCVEASGKRCRPRHDEWLRGIHCPIDKI
ncbi:MAG: septal ring lytic transglycosylase RlpA family protein, partial [Oxalobacteraceae bacterium]